jgi:hypothetical protein
MDERGSIRARARGASAIQFKSAMWPSHRGALPGGELRRGTPQNYGLIFSSFPPLTAAAHSPNVAVVIHNPESEKFLRTAVKAGLRLQEKSDARGAGQSEGVATLQKIKASLRKRTQRTSTKP